MQIAEVHEILVGEGKVVSCANENESLDGGFLFSLSEALIPLAVFGKIFFFG